MAVKWAIANGSWTNGTIWNDGSAPVAGDYVYANGFSVTITNGLNIGTGTLSNAGRDDIGVTAGGRFYIALSGSFNITANIEGGMSGSYATIQKADGQSAGHTTTITGNLRTVVDGARCYADVGTQSLTSYVITGNIDLCDNSSAVRSSNTGSFTLNGNVTTGTGCIVCSSGYRGVFQIVGNVTMNNSILLDGYTSSTIEISGNVTLRNGARFSNTTNTTTIPRISLNNYDSDTNFTTQGVTLVEVNGNFIQSGNNTKFSTRGITTFSIYGTTTLYDTAFVSGTINYLTLIGNLTYEDNPTPLGNLISLTVGDEFEIHCISSGSNNIIMISRFQLENTEQYPSESNVRQGTIYAFGEKTGTYSPDYPPESVVLNGYEYDNGYKTGNMSASAQVGCVTKEDVREGVPLIGMYEDGQQVVGTIIIPAEEDVREGVHYDNDKIGTLIVQGGGDRLRIADFGYYTNAQSDTYIVDITEADKPKFASAEERILIEMFPTLDLDNIPEMYFDDLFVKYLKYRLIVEYYRTAGINSTFTPSEPTTEIVNYRNVTNEVWLNSANIYLNAWNKKYGLNKPPKKVRL